MKVIYFRRQEPGRGDGLDTMHFYAVPKLGVTIVIEDPDLDGRKYSFFEDVNLAQRFLKGEMSQVKVGPEIHGKSYEFWSPAYEFDIDGDEVQTLIDKTRQKVKLDGLVERGIEKLDKAEKKKAKIDR